MATVLATPRYMSGLIFALAKRDLIARYRETVFGIAWAVLRPTLFMLVFSVLKGITNLPSGDVPYPLFSFVGVSLWLLFVSILQGSTPSITRNAGIIRKMPMPRLVFPLSGLLLSLVEYCFALIPLVVLFIVFQWPISPALLLAIPIVFLMALLAFSIGLLIASVSVYKEDILQALPFILQAGLFLSAILYPLSAVPEDYRSLYALNPVVGPLEGIRAVMLAGEAPDWSLMYPALLTVAVLLPLGLWLYGRMSKYFADVL